MGNKIYGTPGPEIKNFKFYQTEDDLLRNRITIVGFTKEEWEREEKRMTEAIKRLNASLKGNEPATAP